MDESEQNRQFDCWMADHIAILHRVVNGFAEGADRHDLLQEVMLAVWKAIPAFRNDAKPSTFIYRVSHNAALTWKRTQQNYRQRIELFERLTDIDSSDETGPDRELLERLYAEIRRLPPLDRSLVLLFLDDVSYREMAQIHGLSESNVGVRLNRLKQKLSEALKGIFHGT